MSNTTAETSQKSVTEQAIDKYHDKTIKIDGRVFRINVEYIEDMMLEVSLIRLSTDKAYRSTNVPSDDEFAMLDEFEKKAYNTSLRIAHNIETDIETDFDGEDV